MVEHFTGGRESPTPKMSITLRGADVVARSLHRVGCRRVFTLSGNHIMSIFDAALDAGIDLVHVRHEAAAVHMADAHGRLTGEAGGVALNLTDVSALRAAWGMTMRNVKRVAPDVSLDGSLVEKMSLPGVELMVGAKRDPAWGTVLLLGLGGIWVEVLGDVQVLPCDADEAQILEALGKLRSAKLLASVRGTPPIDVDAVVQIVFAISRLMRAVPDLTEIDVNPLMVHAKGQGATALDALLVTD